MSDGTESLVQQRMGGEKYRLLAKCFSDYINGWILRISQYRFRSIGAPPYPLHFPYLCLLFLSSSIMVEGALL